MADEDVVVMLDEHALDPTMLIHADAARLSGGRQTCSSTSSSSSRTNPWNNRSVRMHGSTGGLSREQQTHALGADSDGIVRATSPSPSFSSKRRGVAAVVDDDVHTLTVVGKLRVLRLYAAGAVGRSAPNVTRWVTLLPGRFEVRHRTVVTLTEHNVPDRCSRDHGEEEENEEEEKEAKADRNAVGDRSTHRVEEEEEAWIARAMAAAQEGGPSDSLRRAGRQNTDEAAVAHAHNESATQERHVDDPESGDGGRGATRTHRQTKVWRGESAGCGPRQNTRRAVADLFARLRARVPAVQAWERVLRRHPLMHPDDIAHLALSHETAARLSRAMDKALSLPSPACGVIGHEALAVRNAAVWPLRQAASALTAAEPVPRHAHVDANDRDATRQNAWSKASVSCDGSPSSSSSPFSSSSLRDKAQEEQDGEGDEENDDAATWADLNDRLRRKVVNPVYVERYAAARARLSIAAHRQAILDAMAAHPVVIVCGTTGCGKTTQVPQYILDALTERNGRPLSPPHRRPHRGSIWVTQPRRLSAVSIAQRVCAERMETLTDVCGYVIRFDTRPGRHINFCTPAILLRTLYTAPLLDDINYLIIDEIHERDMNTDFLLMLLRHRILAQRPGLRVVLMSATLHAEQFSRYFGGAPIIQVEGYVHPVRELFVEDLVPFAREHRVMTPLLKEVAAATEHGDGAASTPAAPSSSAALSDTPSFCGTSRRRYDVLPSLVEIDYAAVQFAVSQARRMVDLSQSSILVFLPGWEEIMHAKSMLERDAAYHIICLHSSNAVEEQMRCFVPAAPGTIKLILSTNIAESGVTIDDVGAVVDVGCLKEKNYLANGTGWGGGASDDVSNRHSDDIYKKYKYHKYYDTAGGSNRGAHATNSTKGGGGGGGGGGNHASTAQDNLVNHISNNTFDNAEAASEEAEGWDAGVGAAQLLTVYASRANCVQRRGRAGRTRPGVCIRLYSRAHFAALHDFQTPEMLRTPLDGLCLHILALGLGAPEEVMAGALEPPSATAISAAMSRLLSLRAITANITTSRDRAGSGVPAATRSTAWSSAFGSAPRAAPEDVSPATCDSPRSALPRRSSRSRDRGGAGESDHNSDGTSCVVGSRENNAATSLCAASSSTHKLAYALTALGARLAVLPLEPRLGKVVMMGALLGCFDVALTAAVTTDSDVYTHAREQREAVRLHREEFARHTLSDAVASVNGFLFWQRCHALARAPEVVGRLEERQLHIPHLLYVSRTKRQVIEMLSQTRGLLSLGSASCAQSALSKLAASSCTTPSDALSSASTSSAKANIRQRRNVWRSIGEVCIDGSIFSRHSDDVGLLRTALCAGLLPCLAHYVAPRQLRVCACAPAKRAPHSNNDTIKSEQDAAACTHASTTMVVQTSPDSVLHKFRHPHSPEPLFLYNNLFRPRDSRHLVAHGLTAVSLWSVLITAPPTMSLAFDPVLSIGVLDGWVIFHTSREVFELVRRLGAAWAACVEHKCATPEDAEVNGVLVELGAMIRELVNTPLLRGLEPNVQYLSEHAEEPLPVRSQT